MKVDASVPCPHDKEALESALGVDEAKSCPTVRKKVAPLTGTASGDDELGPAIAPHCYPVGNVIIVVQYEEPKTTCTRVVGLAVLPRK